MKKKQEVPYIHHYTNSHEFEFSQKENNKMKMFDGIIVSLIHMPICLFFVVAASYRLFDQNMFVQSNKAGKMKRLCSLGIV
jgi:hypothetical protein